MNRVVYKNHQPHQITGSAKFKAQIAEAQALYEQNPVQDWLTEKLKDPVFRAEFDKFLFAKQVAAGKEFSLRDLREGLQISQATVATRCETTQSEISKIERRQDHKLSTLRRYVEGLGGTLEINFKLNGKSTKLRMPGESK